MSNTRRTKTSECTRWVNGYVGEFVVQGVAAQTRVKERTWKKRGGKRRICFQGFRIFAPISVPARIQRKRDCWDSTHDDDAINTKCVLRQAKVMGESFIITRPSSTAS